MVYWPFVITLGVVVRARISVVRKIPPLPYEFLRTLYARLWAPASNQEQPVTSSVSAGSAPPEEISWIAMIWAHSSPILQQVRATLGRLASVCAGTLLRSLFAVVVPLAVSSYLVAQGTNINEVHVLARGMPSATDPRRQTVRANVDLVLVNVTVLDKAGQAVTGLQPAQFAVLDNKNPQTVRYLSNVDEPISLVVVLDASASMAARIDEVRQASSELVNTSNPHDDVAVIVVRDEPFVALSFKDSTSELQGTLDALRPDGATSLWDAVYLGINELKNSHFQRKAMVVISDGGDNHSRYTEVQLKSLLQEAGAEVYAIGMFDRYATRIEERKGPLQLDEVTSVTGGRVLSVHDPVELSRAVAQISHELRNQYILGYYPSIRSRDGKWRRLKVKLARSASAGKFRLYARKGYYAATE